MAETSSACWPAAIWPLLAEHSLCCKCCYDSRGSERCKGEAVRHPKAHQRSASSSPGACTFVTQNQCHPPGSYAVRTSPWPEPLFMHWLNCAPSHGPFSTSPPSLQTATSCSSHARPAKPGCKAPAAQSACRHLACCARPSLRAATMVGLDGSTAAPVHVLCLSDCVMSTRPSMCLVSSNSSPWTTHTLDCQGDVLTSPHVRACPACHAAG